ncbi:MAG: T9SS type A sorting domain-containing protein, partial [Candidatus Hatepunaea meridiana]|nr:T9SS type A sorting domain-containing protein [Candidatus Hatepunaea meridiana]
STLTVPFELPFTGEIIFTIYDVMGRQLYKRIQNYNRGKNCFILKTTNAREQLSSGRYFLEYMYNSRKFTQKVVLLR